MTKRHQTTTTSSSTSSPKNGNNIVVNSKVQKNNSRQSNKNQTSSSGPCYSIVWIVCAGILIAFFLQICFVYFCEDCSIGQILQKNNEKNDVIENDQIKNVSKY